MSPQPETAVSSTCFWLTHIFRSARITQTKHSNTVIFSAHLEEERVAGNMKSDSNFLFRVCDRQRIMRAILTAYHSN